MKRITLILTAIAATLAVAAPAQAATTRQAERAAKAKLAHYYDVFDSSVSVSCRKRTSSRFECRYQVYSFMSYCNANTLLANGYADVEYWRGYSRPTVLIDETKNDC